MATMTMRVHRHRLKQWDPGLALARTGSETPSDAAADYTIAPWAVSEPPGLARRRHELMGVLICIFLRDFSYLSYVTEPVLRRRGPNDGCPESQL